MIHHQNSLSDLVATLVSRFSERVSLNAHVADQLDTLTARLQGPLRIGMTGLVSAGKSTLVNALLGTAVAPVGEAETTQLLTWFEGGNFEHAELHLTDGAVRQFYLTEDGRIPDRLPVPVAEVASVHVALPTAPLLNHVTIVDTPGLLSIRDQNSARTRDALHSGSADIPELDALIFLLRGQIAEVEALQTFVDGTDSVRGRAANVVAVLTHLDHFDDEPDPLALGRRKARKLLENPQLKVRIADIVPVVGVIAECVRTDSLRLSDLATLARLAVDPNLGRLVLSVDRFKADGASAVEAADRAHLLDKLGLFGVRSAIDYIRSSGPDIDGLRAHLLSVSGFPEIQAAVTRYFLPRSDALKADQAITALERISYQIGPTDGQTLRAELETLLLDPRAHPLREFAALRAAADADPALPESMTDELLRVTGSTDPRELLGLPAGADAAEVTRQARAAARRWQTEANRPLVGQIARDVASVLRRSYLLLAPECTPEPSITSTCGDLAEATH